MLLKLAINTCTEQRLQWNHAGEKGEEETGFKAIIFVKSFVKSIVNC